MCLQCQAGKPLPGVDHSGLITALSFPPKSEPVLSELLARASSVFLSCLVPPRIKTAWLPLQMQIKLVEEEILLAHILIFEALAICRETGQLYSLKSIRRN
jgi:hypothetical protein